MIEIEISGPGGNAFYLLAAAKSYARQLEMDGDAIVAEMKEGDYNHLLKTFDKHFGIVVTLVSNGQLVFEENDDLREPNLHIDNDDEEEEFEFTEEDA